MQLQASLPALSYPRAMPAHAPRESFVEQCLVMLRDAYGRYLESRAHRDTVLCLSNLSDQQLDDVGLTPDMLGAVRGYQSRAHADVWRDVGRDARIWR